MKLVIIGVVAFLVGVGGGTFLAPAPPPPAADGNSAEGPGATPAAPAVSDGAGAMPSPSLSEVSPPASVPASNDLADSASVARLAAVFERLPAADIPPLLGLMTDQQIEGVLRTLAVERAAVVIQAMGAERGAHFSRRLLLPAGGPP